MSAKEMFEKLGYEKRKEHGNIIYGNTKYGVRNHYIEFDDNIENDDRFDCPIVVFYGTDNISIKEIKAIQKQIEELGWNK